jgi:hypothetical protein
LVLRRVYLELLIDLVEIDRLRQRRDRIGQDRIGVEQDRGRDDIRLA